jgi:hypothetical protein
MCEVFSRIIVWLFRSVSFSNWIEILKLLAAAAGFWIGLNQCRKSEAWKRLEFVAAEMKFFYDDAAVKLAMGMLDWRKKRLHSSSTGARTTSIAVWSITRSWRKLSALTLR